MFVRVTGRAEPGDVAQTFYLNLANVSTAAVDESNGSLRVTLVMLGMVSYQSSIIIGQRIRVFGDDARALMAALDRYSAGTGGGDKA